MKVNIIYPYKNAVKYIDEVESNNELSKDELWDKHMIQPFWDEIAKWANGGLEFMKPKVVKSIDKLKKQIEILDKIDFEQIKEEFIKITSSLNKNDDDPILVAIYPLDDNDIIVKEKQNGVIGCCVAGNIIININPLANDFTKWIPFVFAHEYHHSVWGFNWYVIKGGLNHTLIENILCEGQADAFAKTLYPNLKPMWLNQISIEEEAKLWDKYKEVLFSNDRNIINKYTFGSKEDGLPWCSGYYFVYKIVMNYLNNHKDLNINDLIAIHSDKIYELSNYLK